MARAWVDSHCHLFSHAEEPGVLLDRAEDAGVAWVVVPGIDLESSLRARLISREQATRAKWTAGLHPHHAARWQEQGARLESVAAEADAIGECGLDFYRDLAPRAAQVDAFKAQLDLAVALDKPVVVHCRDAFAEVHERLEEASLGPRAILHCWTGGPRWTKRFRELDATFSFAGPITFPGGETVRLGAAEAPPASTMVETDTPYLTPPPHRRRLNEPANVIRVGEALATIWGIEPSEVADATTATATRVFGDG